MLCLFAAKQMKSGVLRESGWQGGLHNITHLYRSKYPILPSGCKFISGYVPQKNKGYWVHSLFGKICHLPAQCEWLSWVLELSPSIKLHGCNINEML